MIPIGQNIGLEISKLMKDMDVTSRMLQALGQQLETVMRNPDTGSVLADAPGMGHAMRTTGSGQAATVGGPPVKPPPPGLQARHVALKLAIAAVLQDALEQALKSSALNLETTVNDLRIKLDALRGLEKPGVDYETEKLKRTIDKRSQMFEMLGGIIKHYDQTAKSATQGIGR